MVCNGGDGFTVSDDQHCAAGVAGEDVLQARDGALEVGSPGFGARCEWVIGVLGVGDLAIQLSRVRRAVSPGVVIGA